VVDVPTPDVKKSPARTNRAGLLFILLEAVGTGFTSH
jgi:hypothetical protein